MRKLSVPAVSPEIIHGHLRMGEPPERPDAIDVTSRYLTRAGRPWLPVIGEFHFSRYPTAEWRAELVKIRAGGITAVATYVFWIMHEERRGVFDWSGDRDLRTFVATCAEVGLDVVARIGPWAHGECRNGGFPDWLMAAEVTPRTDDPRYLALVRPYLAQIADQLRGLDRESGGPIVAIQLENELYDQPEHIVTLKRLAGEAGLHAPLWTATGWGHAQLPADEVIPLFGGYSEAAWDTAHDGWPQQSRAHYFFGPGRDDDSIGADLRIGPITASTSEEHLQRYPFATCELGGGMYTSYHRRPIIDADDIAALALVKLGSGSVAQGYYLYHGASMKIGELSTLQESHATGYPNDCPVINYDFQAPLGEYGQFRESYGRLRLQHLWLADQGGVLATMGLHMPADAPDDTAEKATLRWSVRSDGHRGFLFVNNHQPVETLPEHRGVQFHVTIDEEDLVVPPHPVTVAPGAYFVWPLRQPVGAVTLVTASAQPVCDLVVDGVPTAVLTQVAGIDVQLAFDAATVTGVEGPGTVARDGDLVRVFDLTPGTGCRLRVTDAAGGVADVVVLDEVSARNATRGPLWGADRLVISEQPVIVAEGALTVHGDGTGRDVDVSVYPPVTAGLTKASGFERLVVPAAGGAPVSVPVTRVRAAGPVRRPVIDARSERASAPTDEDFTQAAVYRIEVDESWFDGDPVNGDPVDGDREVLVRLDWIGDVGRAYIGDTLVADQFWYGQPWEIGLRRFRAEVLAYGLELRLLPLGDDYPVYVSPQARPARYDDGQVLELRGAQRVILPRTVLAEPPAATDRLP